MVGLIPGFSTFSPAFGSPPSWNVGPGSGVLDPLGTLQLLMNDPTGAGAEFMASTVGSPADAAAASNPAAAAAAGAPATDPSGGLGAMLKGIQAPEAPKPIFGSGAPSVSPGASNVNVNMPNALSQALRLLPGAQRAGIPSLGQLIRGAI